MPEDATDYESAAEVLTRTRAHAARLIDDLSRQRASLAGCPADRLPAGADAAAGLAAFDGALAAARAVLAAAATQPTAP
jgi:hypothetical protein